MDVRLFIIALFSISFANLTFSQDTIIKIDNSIIIAKILEINESNVKYKKLSYMDGPTYTLSKDKIYKIVYPNGAVEVYTTDDIKLQRDNINNKIEKDRQKAIALEVAKKKQAIKQEIAQEYHIVDRKGVYFGFYTSLGIGGLVLKDNNGFHTYNYKLIVSNQESGISSDFGINLKIYTNSFFGFKTGLTFLNYTYRNTYDIDYFRDEYQESYNIEYHIRNWGIPIQILFSLGGKLAFNIDFGFLIGKPYKATYNIEAHNSNGEFEEIENINFKNNLNNIIIHESIQAGVQYSISEKFFIILGINQIYSLTSYTSSYNTKGKLFAFNISLNFKLDKNKL